jgi:hypothetical protein
VEAARRRAELALARVEEEREERDRGRKGGSTVLVVFLGCRILRLGGVQAFERENTRN